MSRSASPSASVHEASLEHPRALFDSEISFDTHCNPHACSSHCFTPVSEMDLLCSEHDLSCGETRPSFALQPMQTGAVINVQVSRRFNAHLKLPQ